MKTVQSAQMYKHSLSTCNLGNDSVYVSHDGQLVIFTK